MRIIAHKILVSYRGADRDRGGGCRRTITKVRSEYSMCSPFIYLITSFQPVGDVKRPLNDDETAEAASPKKARVEENQSTDQAKV